MGTEPVAIEDMRFIRNDPFVPELSNPICQWMLLIVGLSQFCKMVLFAFYYK